MPGRPRGITVLVPVNQILPIQELKNIKFTAVELVNATQTAELTLQWCARHRLIKNNVDCAHCNVQSTFVKRTKLQDGYVWHCQMSKNSCTVSSLREMECLKGFSTLLPQFTLCKLTVFRVKAEKNHTILPKYLSFIVKQCI